MDQKPNPIAATTQTPDASKQPHTPATLSSADIRKDVERATGKMADVAEDAKDGAVETTREVKGEIVDGAQDLKEKATEVAGEAKATASRVADKVQQSGQKAVEATRAYASTAVDAAGQKVREVQGRLEDAKGKATDFVHEDPMRAVTYTAIASAVVTAALIGLLRRR
jgi:ElaB/YqjD/DUF883 family membrane-anchored ribosome-binding protein